MKLSAKKTLLFILTGAFLLTALVLPAQNTAYFKKNISVLASSKYGGRGYHKDKDALAAGYIARELAAAGAQPLESMPGTDTASGIEGYFQKFYFPINDFNGKMEVRLDGKKLKPGSEFSVQSFSGSGKGEYEILFLDPEETDTGKIMAYLKANGEGKVLAADMMFLRQVMMRHYEEFSRLRPGGMALWMDMSKMSMPGSGMKYMDQVSPLLMSKSYAEPLLRSYPVINVKPGALKNAKKIYFDIEARVNRKEETQNVVACIPGTDTSSDSVLVISAHYDHIGYLGTKTFYPGANDNASGVSMLLSLAKYFGRPENRPETTLIFLATSGEEMGLLGSRYFTEHPPVPLKNIKYVLNLDMLADRTEEIYVATDKRGMKGYRLFEQINRRENLGFDLRLEKTEQNSDHYPFYRKKVPAIDFTMDNGPAFRKLHTPADTPRNAYYGNFPKLLTLFTSFIREY